MSKPRARRRLVLSETTTKTPEGAEITERAVSLPSPEPRRRTEVRPARTAALDDAFAALALILSKSLEDLRLAKSNHVDETLAKRVFKASDVLSKLVRTDILNDKELGEGDISSKDLLELGPEAFAMLAEEGLEVE